MKSLQERLQVIERHITEEKITVMIIGLGSVGTYLLDYLVSRNDPAIRIVVAGRDYGKSILCGWQGSYVNGTDLRSIWRPGLI